MDRWSKSGAPLRLTWLAKPPPRPPDVYINTTTSRARDGAMTLEQMNVSNRIAKLIVGLSWIQDYEIGDGTTETDWNDINLESIKIVRSGYQQKDGLLNVSLKMENCKCQGKHIPHVHGFGTLARSWNTTKALPMERESAVFCKFSLNVNHEALDFESLLKLQHSHAMRMIKEGSKPKVSLTQKILQGDSKMFVFKFSSEDNDGNKEAFEYRVVMKADKLWLLFIEYSEDKVFKYQDNLLPWTVYGILIVIINLLLEYVDNRPSVSLKPNIEQCVAFVPLASVNSGLVYLVKLAKKSSNCIQHGEEFFNIESPMGAPYLYKDSRTSTTMQLKNEQRRLFAEKGVRFPGMVKSSNAWSFDDNHSLNSKAKGMPEAAGAVTVEDNIAPLIEKRIGEKEYICLFEG